MAICTKCGLENKDGVKFCGACGVPMNAEPNPNYSSKDKTTQVDNKDIEDNKGYAIVSYILFLFILPLLFAKNSKFAKFHANQGLLLLITRVGIGIIIGIFEPIFTLILPIFSIIFSTLSGLASLAFLAAAVLGIINASNGTFKELPLIGGFKIIK